MYNDYDYDYDYFINKFNNIPDELWTTRSFRKPGGRCCAYGHCGATGRVDAIETQELVSLRELGQGAWLSMANDGDLPEYNQTTPRERVVAYLIDLKQQKDVLK